MRSVVLGLFVTEGDRAKPEEFVAGVVHVLDIEFEASGRGDRAQLSVRVHNHRYGCSAGRDAADALDECPRLIAAAHPEGVAFPRQAEVSNVNVEIAGCVDSGEMADG